MGREVQTGNKVGVFIPKQENVKIIEDSWEVIGLAGSGSKDISFENVFDKFAMRIVFKSTRAKEKLLAWKIYSIITDHFTPNPTRLRDWISAPKSNGYEALHITVMGPQNIWVEVQIRSERIHEIAEKGYAAHHKYKGGEQKDIGIES